MDNLKVLSYELEAWGEVIEVRLELVKQLDGSERWAIREGGAVLSKGGKWEFEPIPSSRTKSFLNRCRFGSAEEALSFWYSGNYCSRFEHYKTKNL